ncbi:hypothetical protein BH23CHL8_BH23CHL8_23640 [soil metagenome]
MTSPVPTSDPHFPSRWLPLAEEICARYYAEFPDHDERYGARGRDFCAHDNAYLVAWLADALESGSEPGFITNVEWLRSLLEARGFPMDAFRRNLELVGEALAATRSEDGARIRSCIDAALGAGTG